MDIYDLFVVSRIWGRDLGQDNFICFTDMDIYNLFVVSHIWARDLGQCKMAHDRLHSCFVCQIRCFKFKKKMLFRTHGYINLFVVSHTGRGRGRGAI